MYDFAVDGYLLRVISAHLHPHILSIFSTMNFSPQIWAWNNRTEFYNSEYFIYLFIAISAAPSATTFSHDRVKIADK